MRKTKLRQATGLLAAVLCSAALFTGCGNDGGSSESEGSSAQGSENQESGESAEYNSRENSGSESGSQENETAGEVVTIKYLRPGTEVEHNDELVQAINEKLAADGTGLQLEIEGMTYVFNDVYVAVSEEAISETGSIGAESVNMIINPGLFAKSVAGGRKKRQNERQNDSESNDTGQDSV